LFHQSGVIRAGTIDEMFDIATCLDAQPLPNGSRVAIVTNAGGPGILAADACVAAGLTVAEFSPATCARFSAFLPPTASVANPVDMVASRDLRIPAGDRGGGDDRRCRCAHRLFTPVDPAGPRS
jgi:acetyltransferase